MNSHRRNSTKSLEEAGRIQHLVQIGFDTRISRTQKKRIGLGCTLSTKKSSTKAIIPEDWTDSFLRHIPKPRKDHHKLTGYHILNVEH